MKHNIVKGLMLLFSCSFYFIVNSQTSIIDIVPVESKVYQQAHKIFVYKANGKLPVTTALPVFYLTNIDEKDSLFYENLLKMVEEGSMPPMMIVGIYSQMRKTGLLSAMNSHDPKNIHVEFKSDDENYFAFIDKEVIPLIEKKYNCSRYKILSSQEKDFTNYIIKNHPAAFNAYVFEKPFIWVDNNPHAKNTIGIMQPKKTISDIYFPDEYYLKYGKKPSWHQE